MIYMKMTYHVIISVQFCAMYMYSVTRIIRFTVNDVFEGQCEGKERFDGRTKKNRICDGGCAPKIEKKILLNSTML